jgi:hypothetical protein
VSGYSNELGESFRPLIKKSQVNATYAVAIAYVFADTADKSLKSYEKDKNLVKAAKIGGETDFDIDSHSTMCQAIPSGFTSRE